MGFKYKTKDGGQVDVNAVGINIMAKFVQIARREERLQIHLQDKDILSKLESIATNTNNIQLKSLYGRLLKVLAEKEDASPNFNRHTTAGLKSSFWSRDKAKH